jgi:molecular chaperone GrpE
MSEHDETDETVAPDPAGEQVDVEGGAADEAASLDAGPDAPDLETAVAQRDEYLALARQVQADFENFRKRAIKQQTDAAAAATARLVEGLLPVLDALDSAVLHGVEGIGAVHKQLLDVLTRAGLEIVPTDDVPFDPTVHEAVIHEPAEPGTEGDGHGPRISEVLRTGYLWQGRTLRAAMVKVRD